MGTAAIANPDNGYIVDDSIVFKVEITVFGELETILGAAMPLHVCEPLTLSKCLREIFENDTVYDLHLVVGSDTNVQTIKAHRCILKARSPVFSAMLNGTMSEARSGEITIIDIEPAIMRTLLQFMYTDESPSSDVLDATSDKLLVAACKYQVSGMISICEHRLAQMLDHTTIVGLLCLADAHSCTRLKENCMKFLAQHGDVVGRSKEFQQLECSELRTEAETAMGLGARRQAGGSKGGAAAGGSCCAPDGHERRFSCAMS